jgi:hypothetical protein
MATPAKRASLLVQSIDQSRVVNQPGDGLRALRIL